MIISRLMGRATAVGDAVLLPKDLNLASRSIIFYHMQFMGLHEMGNWHMYDLGTQVVSYCLMYVHVFWNLEQITLLTILFQ
jgi:hypothetical protein